MSSRTSVHWVTWEVGRTALRLDLGSNSIVEFGKRDPHRVPVLTGGNDGRAPVAAAEGDYDSSVTLTIPEDGTYTAIVRGNGPASPV